VQSQRGLIDEEGQEHGSAEQTGVLRHILIAQPEIENIGHFDDDGNGQYHH
jgi:hypothetical protein